jgi:hypothetical protein
MSRTVIKQGEKRRNHMEEVQDAIIPEITKKHRQTGSCTQQEPSSITYENNQDDLSQHYFLNTRQQAHDTQPKTPIMTQDRMQVGLLKILKDISAPLCAYDRIMNWASMSAHDGYDFSSGNFPSCRAVMNRLYNEFHLDNVSPMSTCVELTCAHVDVVTFNFREMMCSLLTDPNLMQEENLVFWKHPLEAPCPNPTHVDEINTSTWYWHAHQTLCTNPNDLLCGIILFIDKTHTDTIGKLTLEPVSFTLSIFKHSVRTKSSAW